MRFGVCIVASVECQVGVDLVAVLGLSAGDVQTIITEVGTDMSRFPTSKHFCAWLGLAPRNAISGSKVLHSHTTTVANRATQAFLMRTEPCFAPS